MLVINKTMLMIFYDMIYDMKQMLSIKESYSNGKKDKTFHKCLQVFSVRQGGWGELSNEFTYLIFCHIFNILAPFPYNEKTLQAPKVQIFSCLVWTILAIKKQTFMRYSSVSAKGACYSEFYSCAMCMPAQKSSCQQFWNWILYWLCNYICHLIQAF